MVKAAYWPRYGERRITRRRALAGAATLAASASAAAIAGCDDGGAREPSTQAPRPGGTLRTGTSLPVATGLDPQTETGTGLAIFPQVYGYLLHVNPDDDSVILDHAASVEQPDETTIIVKLRPDVRFQRVPPADGRAVAAQDVVASIERYRDNPLVASKLWHASILERAEATDAGTLRVTTKRPYVYSLAALGGISSGAILPREVVEQQIDVNYAGAGSGPFTVESVEPASAVRIARHGGYYGMPLPYLDGMAWQIYADDAAKLRAFRERSVDVVPNRGKLEADEARAISDEVEVSREPSLAYVSLGLRVDRPPFADARVREAVDLALDRQALVRDILLGDGEVLGPVNPHLARGFWSLPREEIVAASGGALSSEESIERARALVGEAGAMDVAVQVQVADTPETIDVAARVVERLRAVGLAAEAERLSVLTWFVNLRRGHFEATLISHEPHESPDVPTRLYHSGGPEGIASPFGFAGAEIDALVERSWAESDREQRHATLLEAQRLMVAARPLLPLFTGAGYSSAWSYVRNRRPELPGSLAQYNYEQWIDAAALTPRAGRT